MMTSSRAPENGRAGSKLQSWGGRSRGGRSGSGELGAISVKQFLRTQKQDQAIRISWIEDDLVCRIGDNLGMPDARRTTLGDFSDPYSIAGWPLQLETCALAPPIDLDVDLPPGSWQPGQTLHTIGPQGPLSLNLPAHAVPGEKLRVRLAPQPEFRVEVPPDVLPGSTVRFRIESGDELRVVVPSGVEPGDTFEVTPPTMMVRVPETAQPGDIVKFSHPNNEEETYQVCVPDGLLPCSYFPTRLPVADGALSQGHL